MKKLLISLFLLFFLQEVLATEYFVAPTGNDSADGLSWATPLLTISNGIIKATTAGDIVTVSNGTYNISTQLVVGAGITVRSYYNGAYGNRVCATNTIIKSTANNARIFNITNSAATIAGFTLTGGRAAGDSNTGYGGAVRMNSGMITDCIITNNAVENRDGGGIYIINGGAGTGPTIITNCYIADCRVSLDYSGRGGGIAINGGATTPFYLINSEIRRCQGNLSGGGIAFLFADNSVTYTGTVRQCLIADNSAANGGPNTGGGGIYQAGNSVVYVESSSIVSNIGEYGGGITEYVSAGNYPKIFVTNSIVYANACHIGGTNYYQSNLDELKMVAPDYRWKYSCTYPTSNGWHSSMTTNDPKFVSVGDYRLTIGSSAIDTGTNQTWMVTGTDLDNKDRIYNLVVDMGCYEYSLSAGVISWSIFRPNLILKANLAMKNQETLQ